MSSGAVTRPSSDARSAAGRTGCNSRRAIVLRAESRARSHPRWLLSPLGVVWAATLTRMASRRDASRRTPRSQAQAVDSGRLSGGGIVCGVADCLSASVRASNWRLENRYGVVGSVPSSFFESWVVSYRRPSLGSDRHVPPQVTAQTVCMHQAQERGELGGGLRRGDYIGTLISQQFLHF